MATYCEEPPAFYDEKLVVAHEVHRCCETGNAILPGQKYWCCTGKWDGQMTTFRQSEGAYHFARYLNLDVLSGDCIPFGAVEHELRAYGDRELLAEWERVKAGEVTRPGR